MSVATRIVAERDGWICNGCGESVEAYNPDATPQQTRYATVDHKDPKGGNDSTNVWLLCNVCNSSKGRKSLDEWNRSLDFDSSFMRKGFTAVPNALIENSALTLGARMTLIALMSFAWRGDPFPGQMRLAEMLGCTDRTIREYLVELRDKKFLKVARRGRGKTNVYRISGLGLMRTPEDSSALRNQDRKQGSVLDRKQGSYKEDEVEEDKVIAATPRNPIWDALTQVFGEATTETARSRRGKVCRSLAAAGANPEEIVRRAKSWPRHFDDATLTELALEKHWDTLAHKPLRMARNA